MKSNWFNDQIILLGNYTLLAYLAQTVLARVFFIILKKMGLHDFTYYFPSFLLVGFSTWIVVIITRELQRKYVMFDRIYHAIF